MTYWSRCYYGLRSPFSSGCRMWAKPLKRNVRAYLIFEMSILVPASRQRFSAAAFPLSRIPCVMWQEDTMVSYCGAPSGLVSQPTHWLWSQLDTGLLFRADWEFREIQIWWKTAKEISVTLIMLLLFKKKKNKLSYIEQTNPVPSTVYFEI